MVFAIFIALFSLFIRLGAILGVRPVWSYDWFRGFGPMGEARLARRVRKMLTRGLRQHSGRLFSPLLVLGAVLMPLAFIEGFGYLSQFLGLMILVYGLGAILLVWGGVLDRAHAQAAIYAAQRAAWLLPPGTAMAILREAAAKRLPQLRLAAVEGLRYLATPEAEAQLAEMVADPAPEVAALATQYLEAMRQQRAGLAPLASVLPLHGLVESHAVILTRLGRKKWRTAYTKSLKQMEEMVPLMDEMVLSQRQLYMAYPHLYCDACQARAVKQAYESWHWVECRVCRDVLHLRTGIVHVVGVIGETEELGLKDGVLRVRMWNEERRSAVPGDIDSLEIYGGQDIHYDWAINAVLEDVQQHQDEGNGLHFPIHIFGELTLEQNTQRLMALVDPRLGG